VMNAIYVVWGKHCWVFRKLYGGGDERWLEHGWEGNSSRMFGRRCVLALRYKVGYGFADFLMGM